MRPIVSSTLVLVFSCLVARAETLTPPEQEVDGALTRLEELSKLMQGIDQIEVVSQVNPQLYQAKNSLEAGRRYFDNHEYLAAAREFYFFLTLSPGTSSSAYLEVQKKLGEANENLRLQTRAKVHYHNYLAAFLTHNEQNYEDFITVLKHLLALVAKDDAKDRQRIKTLLAAITSMVLPEHMKHEVYYLAARTAFIVGLPTAVQWLANSAEFAENKDIRARSLYFAGLIAVQLQDWDRAKRIFTEALKRNQGGSEQLNDWCHLALAKIDATVGKFEESQRSYQKIPETSPSYKDALYEGIFVNLATKNFPHARTDAAVFISSNHGDQRTPVLRSLTPYFDLLAGDGEAGNQGIQSATENLGHLEEELASKRNSELPLTRTELSQLLNLTRADLDQPPMVPLGLHRFRQMDELGLTLSNLKNEIRDTIFTLGRIPLLHMQPDWINRSRVLETNVRSLLEIGHRLAATERNLYFDSLSEPERLKLTSSEQLRVAMVQRHDTVTASVGLWEYFSAYAKVVRNYATSYQRLLDLRADLASVRLLAEDVQMSSADRREVVELRRDVASLLDGIETRVQELRLENVTQLTLESPNIQLGELVQRYATALRSEVEILAQTRLKRTSISEQIQIKKAILAWERWEFMLGNILTQHKRLENEVAKRFKEIVTSLKQAYFTYATLAQKLGSLRRDLTKNLTDAKPIIVDQYLTQIRRRMARNQKWLADIQWAKSDRAEGKLGQLSTEMQVERQTLEQRLNAMEQGVLLEWPN